MTSQNFSTYQSPFTWRYSSDHIRQIWSEENKRIIWRQIWIAVAKVQSEFGLISNEQLEDLRNHAKDIDMRRALEIEEEIRHDLMAELKTFAEQCRLGGGVIHLGMTSTDIVDNADVIRVRDSLDILISNLRKLISILLDLIDRWADYPIMGFTHLQPAEPTTLGYRFAQYAQDLDLDIKNIIHIRKNLKGKGIRGAVGTSGSFSELIGEKNLTTFERRLSDELDLPFFEVTTQVYPRKQDYLLLTALAGLGATLYKFSFDLRFLQTPSIGELAEPFDPKQVGSSAMPFKRNPVQAEKINSLARLLAQFPRIAWDDAALTVLERTLDDSANRRIVIPEAFLIADEILRVSLNIFIRLQIDENAIHRTLSKYGPFSAIEKVLMALGKAGANRQEMHEKLRRHSLEAWSAIQAGYENPLLKSLINDEGIKKFIDEESLKYLLDSSNYTGSAGAQARNLSQNIRKSLDL